jgi:hypothetical protein
MFADTPRRSHFFPSSILIVKIHTLSALALSWSTLVQSHVEPYSVCAKQYWIGPYSGRKKGIDGQEYTSSDIGIQNQYAVQISKGQHCVGDHKRCADSSLLLVSFVDLKTSLENFISVTSGLRRRFGS